MRIKFIFAFLLFYILPTQALVAEELVEGYSHDEALRLGERMYREGVLPSGDPMMALVMGDIPFDGRMFTCDDCHQRSGLGSEEGTIITWPTNGKELFAPRRRTGAYRPPSTEAQKQDGRRELPKYFQMDDVRPAYTDKSLARVLRVGVDPTGRTLDPIMPKYLLGQRDMRILVYYLKNLSVNLSPGVGDTTLQFATVVAGNVSDEDKTAMLSVLQTHIDAHNSLSRHEHKRAAAGPFYKSERHQAYRKLNLHVWSLHGPEETWREQLERYYKQEPVFALLGGITEESWTPIHEFCEENKIPSIFPITNLPVISESDWYTLYFSKGFYQEGEMVAKYIRANVKDEDNIKIVQLYQEESRQSSTLAQGFQQTWQKMGNKPVDNIAIKGDRFPSEQLWDNLFAGSGPLVLLVWLDGSHKGVLNSITLYGDRVKMVFAASTLLNFDYSGIADDTKEKLLVTYPYRLPSANDPRRFSVEQWLKVRKIPLTNFDIQAKMYFLGWMLPGAIKNMRSEFFREYFLEGYDMMVDQDYAIAVYPRLTFGSGQRYASKGCYIVQLKQGFPPEIVPVTDWVTY